MNELTQNQKKIFNYLKHEGVLIEHKNKMFYVTKFGLIFIAITIKTFNALYPYLRVHDNDKYSLKRNLF